MADHVIRKRHNVNELGRAEEEIGELIAGSSPSRGDAIVAIAEKMIENADPPPWLSKEEIKQAIGETAEGSFCSNLHGFAEGGV